MNIKEGDISQLGEHLLAFGDATDTSLVNKLLQGRSVTLILSDPPFGIAYVENRVQFNQIRKNKPIANDQDQSEEEYRLFTKKWLEAVKPYLTTKNAFYIFNSDRKLFSLRDGIKDAGFRFTQLLIWVKNKAVLGRLDYLAQHELIVYGWYGTHTFQKSQDKSVLFYPKPNKSPLHPTMKPVGLLRNLILNSSRIGNYVYDPFGGSGSTLIACEQTKRKCLMIELDLEYCETIIKRYEKVTGIKSERIIYERVSNN